MNIGELNRLLVRAGHPRADDRWGRVRFEGSTMISLGDRDDRTVTDFGTEDAMFRWVLARTLVGDPPRRKAVVRASAITAVEGRGVWRVIVPEHAVIRAVGNGMIAVLDTTGFYVDPKHGASQITILDAATGTILATWLPPHGVSWAWFDGATLILDDLKEHASVCDPLTGNVIRPTATGGRIYEKSPLLPNILHAERTTSRLEAPDGRLIWERPGYVRGGARAHGLSIFKSDDSSVVEATRDDGTTAWTAEGSFATVTDTTVWLDDEPMLRIIDLDTGRELALVAAPWGSGQLYFSPGWVSWDGLVFVVNDDDHTIAAYTSLAT